VLPFRKKTKPIYEASGVKRDIAGIPIVTICGIVWVAFLVLNIYFFFADPNIGALDFWSEIWQWRTADEMWGVGFSIIMTAVIFISGFSLWWIARWYRKKQGINVDLAYQELPPE